MQGYSVFSLKVSSFPPFSSLPSNPTSSFSFKDAELNLWGKRVLDSRVVNPSGYAPNKPLLYFKVCMIAEKHPEILFIKVNFDENKSLCKSLNVKVLPYFHFYRGADGLLDSFSCSLAKLQKLKDAIANYNPAHAKES